MTITRFAPSPTGYLHIGGVRTALYSWLYARQNNGKFILRIEDTDRERSTTESVSVILDGMKWLGLDYDEGPLFQTERFDRYRQIIQQLLDQGDAYYCYCSKERLDDMRSKQRALKQKPRYDGSCRQLKNSPTDIKPVIRFRNPLEGAVVIDDIVKSKVTVNNSELDDLIIARADGTPTYNLTVVVDDMDMGITHVIRGDDHLNNTPRQINILTALGAKLPIYAHVPMILGNDGSRLSKRHGAVNILQYRDEGYLPAALLNYLVRLGWSHEDKEIFTKDEMIEFFRLDKVNSAASTFNSEKLLWLNQQYIMNCDIDYLSPLLREQFNLAGLEVAIDDKLTAIIKEQRQRAKTMHEMAATSIYFYQDVTEYEQKSAAKFLTAEALPPLTQLIDKFSALDSWQAAEIKNLIKQTISELAIGFAKAAQPLRVAVSGTASTPSIDITLELIGKQQSIKRIQRAVEYITKV